MGKPSWDDDGEEDDSPSSMDVLLQWLEENATRWLQGAGKGGGSRVQMTYEILDRMLAHGINNRSVHAISSKLRTLEFQLQTAEHWLRSRGLQRYDCSKKTPREVLHMCPYYPEIKPLLRPKRSVTSSHVESPTPVIRPQRNCHEDNDFISGANALFGSSDEEEVGMQFGVGNKRRTSLEAHDEETKRARVEHHLQDIKLEGSKCVAFLEADPEERREFFKLELQVKRDEAILVRAKARKELEDMGVSTDDIDRLLPL